MNAPQKMEAFPGSPALKAVEQAAKWHVRLHGANATDADHAAFHTWIKRHPDHAEAYRRLESLWGKFDGVDAAPAIAALENALQSGRRSTQIGKTIVFGLLLMVTGTIAIKSETAGYLMSDYSTAVGKQQVVELADNSRITLNTYSAIDVNLSDSQRHITLHEGEILVDVAKDATRPFIVETSQGTIRALGTSFVVRREGDITSVNVVESKVEACTAKSYFHSKNNCVRLNAGQGSSMAKSSVEQAKPINIESAAGWAGGMLAVDNRPLSEVLKELERYRYGRIHADAEISDLRVSGVFPLNDTDRTLDMLAGLLPIQAHQYTTLLTVVRAR